MVSQTTKKPEEIWLALFSSWSQGVNIDSDPQQNSRTEPEHFALLVILLSAKCKQLAKIIFLRTRLRDECQHVRAHQRNPPVAKHEHCPHGNYPKCSAFSTTIVNSWLLYVYAFGSFPHDTAVMCRILFSQCVLSRPGYEPHSRPSTPSGIFLTKLGIQFWIWCFAGIGTPTVPMHQH